MSGCNLRCQWRSRNDQDKQRHEQTGRNSDNYIFDAVTTFGQILKVRQFQITSTMTTTVNVSTENCVLARSVRQTIETRWRCCRLRPRQRWQQGVNETGVADSRDNDHTR